MLYSLVVGSLPFDGGRDKRQQVAAILEQPLAIRGAMREDAGLRELLETMLVKTPTQRLSLDRVAAHRWLAKGGGAGNAP